MKPYENLYLKDIDGEIWRPIPLSEKILVSNYGRFKSIRRSRQTKYKDIIYKQFLISGYPHVLFHVDGRRHNYYSHKLVAIVYLPNPENKTQVNHKDGNKLNNMVDNLEWCTPLENTQHSNINKLVDVMGVNNPKNKLSEKQVLEIFNSKLSGLTLAKVYGVSSAVIYHIKNGYIWNCVTGLPKKLRKNQNTLDYAHIRRSEFRHS